MAKRKRKDNKPQFRELPGPLFLPMECAVWLWADWLMNETHMRMNHLPGTDDEIFGLARVSFGHLAPPMTWTRDGMMSHCGPRRYLVTALSLITDLAAWEIAATLGMTRDAVRRHQRIAKRRMNWKPGGDGSIFLVDMGMTLSDLTGNVEHVPLNIGDPDAWKLYSPYRREPSVGTIRRYRCVRQDWSFRVCYVLQRTLMRKRLAHTFESMMLTGAMGIPPHLAEEIYADMRGQYAHALREAGVARPVQHVNETIH